MDNARLLRELPKRARYLERRAALCRQLKETERRIDALDDVLDYIKQDDLIVIRSTVVRLTRHSVAAIGCDIDRSAEWYRNVADTRYYGLRLFYCRQPWNGRDEIFAGSQWESEKLARNAGIAWVVAKILPPYNGTGDLLTLAKF
jgi:hypothetical protein